MDKLKDRYDKKYQKELASEFKIKNLMAVPRITKIVVNVGIGDLEKNRDGREKLINEIAQITGQKPRIQPARISVAGFGIRQGMPVGLTVTLRGNRMYDFFEKFVSVVLPRLRDFKGVSPKSFDKQGNYTIGLRDHTVFPEIDLSKVDKPHGMEITFVTSTKDSKLAHRLLEIMGMPFRKEE